MVSLKGKIPALNIQCTNVCTLCYGFSCAYFSIPSKFSFRMEFFVSAFGAQSVLYWVFNVHWIQDFDSFTHSNIADSKNGKVIRFKPLLFRNGNYIPFPMQDIYHSHLSIFMFIYKILFLVNYASAFMVISFQEFSLQSSNSHTTFGCLVIWVFVMSQIVCLTWKTKQKMTGKPIFK